MEKAAGDWNTGGRFFFPAFVTLGIYSIYFSLKVRGLHGILGKISTDLKLRFQKIQKDIQEELMAEETTGT
jgi:hypothetical protein